MDISMLIQEGERLSRPAILLSTKVQTASQVVGIWGGKGYRVVPQTGHYRGGFHWITLDTGLFNQVGLHYRNQPYRGTLSVFENPKWARPFQVFYNPDQIFQTDDFKGQPLSARLIQILPPFEAICLYGGPQIEAWLTSLGRKRLDYSLDDGPDDTPATQTFFKLANAYGEHYERRAPFHINEGKDIAFIGGWPMSWPDDNFYMPAEVKFLCMTVQSAEPWLEIWNRGWNFWVTARIT